MPIQRNRLYKKIKPPPGRTINWNSHLTKGLKMLTLFDYPNNAGTGPLFDYKEPDASTSTSNDMVFSVGSLGKCYRAVNTTDDIVWTTDTWLPETKATILVIREKTDATNRDSTLFGSSTVAGNRCGTHCPYSDGVVYFDFGGQSGDNRISISGLSFQGVEKWAFIAGTRGSSIWRNGVLLVSQPNAITRSNAATSFFINNGNGVEGGDLQKFFFFAVLDAEWTAGMIKQWNDDPYCMFDRPRRSQNYLFVTPPAPGGGVSSVMVERRQPRGLGRGIARGIP